MSPAYTSVFASVNVISNKATITGRKNAVRESYRGYTDLCAKKTDTELHMAREGHSLFL